MFRVCLRDSPTQIQSETWTESLTSSSLGVKRQSRQTKSWKWWWDHFHHGQLYIFMSSLFTDQNTVAWYLYLSFEDWRHRWASSLPRRRCGCSPPSAFAERCKEHNQYAFPRLFIEEDYPVIFVPDEDAVKCLILLLSAPQYNMPAQEELQREIFWAYLGLFGRKLWVNNM